ncbi:MAG TPA: hypothetical protein PKW28_16400, partial [Turneriella sp.]|nr:hypothetical protein [Turneriella sp.]
RPGSRAWSSRSTRSSASARCTTASTSARDASRCDLSTLALCYGAAFTWLVAPHGIRRTGRGVSNAQTAVGLRKVWTEIARLSEQGRQLQFPLVQRIREDGTNEFLIGEK